MLHLVFLKRPPFLYNTKHRFHDWIGTVKLKDSRVDVTFDLLSYARTRILSTAINENVSNYRRVRCISANFVGVAVDVEYLFDLFIIVVYLIMSITAN